MSEIPPVTTPIAPIAPLGGAGEYTAEHIRTHTGLSGMRHRPTEYLRSLETPGLVHAADEVLDNAFDEAVRFGAQGVLRVVLFQDKARGTYQIAIQDNGRGIPIEKLVDVTTTPGTSGKFDQRAYDTSAGLFGKGLKVAAATAEDFLAITRRPEGIASIHVHRGEHGTRPDFLGPAVPNATGVTVILEPDKSIFTPADVEAFDEGGYNGLIEKLKKLSYFRPINASFHIASVPFPPKLWTAQPEDVLAHIETAVQAAECVFAVRDFDYDRWIRQFWGVTRPWAWTFAMTKPAPDDEADDLRSFVVRLYAVKFEARGARLGVINGVNIDASDSNHLSVVQDALVAELSPMIEDSEVRKFFHAQYRLPIFIAVDVRYRGAQPTGTTKHAFYNVGFREVYGQALRERLRGAEAKEAMKALYELLKADIEAKFEAAMAGGGGPKSNSRLDQLLNYPERFRNCATTNRSLAELFIVEGDSAGSSVGRDAETQGAYLLTGKPLNGVDTEERQREARIAIQRNEIYQDILRILRVNPQNFDPAAMYYKRLIIMTDADSHGRHIASILTGNLYVVCPPLIEGGYVHVVTPPYYGITYKRRGGPTSRKEGDKIFMRNALDYLYWMSSNVYEPTLDIEIRSPRAFPEPIRLRGDHYHGLVALVLAAGEALRNLAAELRVDEFILEQLTRVTQYLHVGNVNVAEIQKQCLFDHVQYDPHGHLLIISAGLDDYTVPLMYFTDRIYQELMPKLRALEWRQLELYITSKNVTNFQRQRMSVYQLYLQLKAFDDLFDVKSWKGLGSMSPKDRAITCMDPRFRTTHEIRGVGDVQTIFDLLGRHSAPRKKLLSR